ncbi:Retrotransposon nucleocapsid protein, partial [Globisporangium splendens]
MPIPTPQECWDVVSMDSITGLSVSEGFDAIFVTVDKLSKRPKYHPTHSTADDEGTAKVFFEAVVRHHGLPKVIISDRDPKFTSDFWKSLTKLMGIKLSMTTSHRAQADGQTERQNLVLEDALRCMVSYHGDDWVSHLGTIEFAHATLVNESTKFTPFEVDTGRKVRNLIAQEFGVEGGVIEQVDVAEFAKNFAEKRQQIIKLAQENLKQAQERQKKYYDRKRRDVEFEAGNLVVLDTKNLPLKTVARSTSLQKAKLAAKKVGPFKIDAMVNKNVARLVLPPNMKRLHPAFNVELLSHYVENPTKFYTRPIPKAVPAILDDETGEALHVVEALLRRKVHNRQSMCSDFPTFSQSAFKKTPNRYSLRGHVDWRVSMCVKHDVSEQLLSWRSVCGPSAYYRGTERVHLDGEVGHAEASTVQWQLSLQFTYPCSFSMLRGGTPHKFLGEFLQLNHYLGRRPDVPRHKPDFGNDDRSRYFRSLCDRKTVDQEPTCRVPVEGDDHGTEFSWEPVVHQNHKEEIPTQSIIGFREVEQEPQGVRKLGIQGGNFLDCTVDVEWEVTYKNLHESFSGYSSTQDFGFIAPEHSTALQKLWVIVTSSIPVLLWRTRVEIVHERQHLTIEDSTQRVWTACVMQVRAVAHRMRTLKGEKIDATCLSQLLSVLERQDLSRQLEAWATARLYFDGSACGNPGPGGSGWALILLNECSNRWELKACGYAYMGPEVTSNWCEYSALKDGLTYSAHYLQHYEVKLEVFGDSQMIIAAQNGFSSIRQTKLQPLAVRVNQIIANFAWTSWNHTKREQNKMADLLANMAMNSKTAKILTDESRGNDQVVMSQVAALLGNDIGATPSKLRNTSLSAVLMRLRDSSTVCGS